MIRSFNPRARVGRDQARRLLPYVQQRFNPRARVGRDTGPDGRSSGRCGFNPRARVGRDNQVQSSMAGMPSVSIHAPAWGATLRSY